ncbi:hypothetical protein HGRIS_007975 [Hohenbuehelia grisea]|uniref:Carbohydrate kinase PfkB domain-containing protein n=1 Tax=Hohenbuehelia grisea TaxID=104357 RepID=A0ABR3J6Y2_9AGAR
MSLSCRHAWTRCSRLTTRPARGLSSLAKQNAFLDIHEEVQHALAKNIPVVALETAVVTHGFPAPENLQLAKSLEEIVRSTGCVPATMGLLDGRIKIGLKDAELERLANSSKPVKVSRRDIGPALAKRVEGGTTCSATLICAAMAGIKVFATGGLGGVHRGGENCAFSTSYRKRDLQLIAGGLYIALDVSADLPELSRCPVGLVSAGVKSILDIGRTLEYLETLGVPVLAYGETTDFPAFFSRKSGFQAPYNVNTPRAAAEILYAQAQLGLQHGALIAVPIPEKFEAAGQEIQKAVDQAVAESEANGVSKLGKAATPWLLTRIGELTQRRSLASNIALLENTALIGGQIAVEYSKLGTDAHIASSYVQYKPTIISKASENTTPVKPAPAKLVVAGTAAVDITAHASPTADAALSVHSTSPGSVCMSLGGVARNVAEAAHKMSASSDVLLVSPIGDDGFGRLLTTETESLGMRTDGFIRVGGRSAVCNMLLSGDGNLMGGVADMGITEDASAEQIEELIADRRPSIVSLDGNLSTSTISKLVAFCNGRGIHVFFEPTSITKSTRIIPAVADHLQLGRKTPAVGFISPNLLELSQLYEAASSDPHNLTSHPEWWTSIDRYQLGQDFRDGLAKLSRKSVSDNGRSEEKLGFLADRGVVQMAVNLLPFFQRIIIKCGPHGVVVVMHVPTEAAAQSGWLNASVDRAIIVANDRSEVVVVRHFPAQPAPGIVNVTGAGDTFVGVLLASLLKEPELFDSPESLERYISLAQQGAVLTLQSPLAISPELATLRIG